MSQCQALGARQDATRPAQHCVLPFSCLRGCATNDQWSRRVTTVLYGFIGLGIMFEGLLLLVLVCDVTESSSSRLSFTEHISWECVLQHCDLVKSAEDPNTYLINDTADPLQQSLSGLLLDGLPPSASAAFAPRTGWCSPIIYAGNFSAIYLMQAASKLAVPAVTAMGNV